MLIVFKSRAYGNVTMFGDIAVKLLKLMGHSGNVPGAILPEKIPEALNLLRKALAEADAEETGVAEPDQQATVEFIDEPVSLRNRAFPLIELLEAAASEGVPVMWETQS